MSAAAMTPEALVAAIDALGGDDPEHAHAALDDLLEAQQPEAVQDAMKRLYGRCSWWACA